MLPAFFMGILAVQPGEAWTRAAFQSSAFSFAFPLALAAGVQTVSLAQRRLACFVRESRFLGFAFFGSQPWDKNCSNETKLNITVGFEKCLPPPQRETKTKKSPSEKQTVLLYDGSITERTCFFMGVCRRGRLVPGPQKGEIPVVVLVFFAVSACCCCAFPCWRAPARPPGSCVPAWGLPLPSGPTPR